MNAAGAVQALFVSSQTELGGAEISLLTALKRIDRSRVEPVVATLGFGAGDYPERLRAAGVEVHELSAGRARNPFSWARAVLRLARLVRRGGFQVAVSNGYHPHFYGGPAARLAGARSVLFCRDFPHPPGSVPLVERAAFAFGAARYLVASEAMRRAVLERTGGRRPVDVVPNGVELDVFRPDPQAAAALRAELGLAPRHLIVTAAGRLQPWKGQHVFLEAAARVAREVPEARFLVVGEALFGQDRDYPGRLREQARESGLSEKVIFTGNRSDMPILYAASDVVAHSSVQPEPFGRVILEAMAAGRPVVVARAGGAAELFEEGRSGLGYRPGDAGELAEKITVLCRDEELRLRVGAAGRERAERSYAADVSAGALARALGEAILPGTAGPAGC